jgi:hypothetical protein
LYERFLANGKPGQCQEIARHLGETEISELLNWWDSRTDEKAGNVTVDVVDERKTSRNEIGRTTSSSVPLSHGVLSPVTEMRNHGELSLEKWEDLIMDE